MTSSLLSPLCIIYYSVLTGLETYFILGRKSDQESTAETTVWLDEVNVAPSTPVVMTINSSNGSSSQNKKANSLPSILDEMANSTSSNCNHSGPNGNCSSNCSSRSSHRDVQETPLRTTRSVSQDRKKRLFHQQKSQQDELAALSTGIQLTLIGLLVSLVMFKLFFTFLSIYQGLVCPIEMRSSNAIVCAAGQNGRTDDLSLFPSVESFIKAQGASTTNTLQRRHASTSQPPDLERTSTYLSIASANRDAAETDDVLSAETAACNVVLHASLSRFHQLRKQSDLQMIRCIQEDESHRVYFMRPPLSQLTVS